MSGTGTSNQSTGGSFYDTASSNYYGVPYTPSDFNPRTSCPSITGEIEDYKNPFQVLNSVFIQLKYLQT